MPVELSHGVFSVTQLTSRVREVLAGDPTLGDIWVAGEVSNLTRSSAGHVYFTLKDERAALSCVAWRSTVNRWTSLPSDGMALLAHGNISVYEAQGRYQLYVDQVEPTGLGQLYVRFQALKERLEAEGLFRAERKRSLPRFPRVVGVVTSAQAAALQDILRTLTARFPAVEVVLAPTLVQGDGASVEVVRALRALDRLPEMDVIILTRGGGSLEDLWTFNEESVARTVAACVHPVVTGIGHETDFTIADFVADYRAPTPTAAAMAVVPDRLDILREVDGLSRRLETGLETRLQDYAAALASLKRMLLFLSPAFQVQQQRQRVDDLERRLDLLFLHRLDRAQRDVRGLGSRLRAASPQAVLDRGYVLVRRKVDGSLLRRVAQVVPGDALSIRMADGEFEATAGATKGLAEQEEPAARQ